jgi:hypothetical protein
MLERRNMASRWYYKRDGKQHGPFTSPQLKELPASGHLGPYDLVWKESLAEWLPASNLKGLFPGDVDVMAPTTPQVAVAASTTSIPPVPPPVPSKAVPPPVPPKAKAVPPPVPSKSKQPSSVSAALVSPVEVLAGASATMRNLTGVAAAKAKQINAGIPDRITVGKFAFPKKVAVGMAAALLLVVGVMMFWPKSKSAAKSPVAAEPKSFRQQIAGDWIATIGDGTMQVKNDTVILGGMGLSVTQMLPYQVDEAKHVITFMVGKNIWTAKLDEDRHFYAQQQGGNEVVTFAREYKGGWHEDREIDRGNRSPGLEGLDRPQADAGASPEKEPWGAGLPRSSVGVPGPQPNGTLHSQVDTSHLHGSTHINGDGSFDGTMTGDGFSAHSHLNSDGSGQGEYKVNGQTMTVKRAADGSTTVER